MPEFKTDAVAIHYKVHGSGPPLVLLHGLGSSERDWEYQVPTLAKCFEVITPDLRGFGQSDKPDGPYLMTEHVADLSALLDHLGHRKIHLLGYSMGGAAAFQFAADHPERVERLIIVNSSPSFELDHWRKRLELLVRSTVIRCLGMKTLAGLIAKRLFPDPGQEDLRAMTIERYSQNARAAYLAALGGLAGWTIGNRLDSLTMPILVMAAEHDYTPFEEKQAYVARLPDARLVKIDNSRHGTPIDQPEVFNQLVLEFLQGDKSQEASA